MGDLYVGERLLLSDGHEAVVESLQREYAPAIFENWTPGKASTGTLGTPADPQTGTFTTHNFEVADWHTYFVTGSEASRATWVHNTGGLCPDREFMRSLKDAGVPRNIREAAWDSKARQLRLDELAPDPARAMQKNYREAGGGLRIEQQTGQRVQRSADGDADFLVGGNPVSLKGPVPPHGSATGLGNAAVRDANRNTATKQLHVDLNGLSPQQAKHVKDIVSGGSNKLGKDIFFWSRDGTRQFHNRRPHSDLPGRGSPRFGPNGGG